MAVITLSDCLGPWKRLPLVQGILIGDWLVYGGMSRHALIWLKRDLRLHDHAPLAAAADFDAAAAVYVIEPDWLASPECDSSHVAFVLDGLAELREALAARGLPLLVRVGEVRQAFEALRAQFHFTDLLSHEETGPGWSYARDRAVAAWCRQRSVRWREWPQNGVVRGLRSRDGWARHWHARMSVSPILPPVGFRGASGLHVEALPELASLGLAPHGKTLQPSGERAARATLRSFLDHRGHGYLKAISSPLSAETGGSRLSPYLAFGMLSMRTAHQATASWIARSDDAFAKRALRGFSGRLHWHCHFMQKLESQPSMEFRNLARSVDGLREGEFNRSHFDAWCAGQTGYPMVDACMRSLHATGWLNFRMRAMLVSFASYHLWLHWREPGLFLARQFLDFEPGIHWSQFQMQSGTTGINALRIYSPTKQAREHDPHGVFIRRWLPELTRVPLPLLAEPWRLTTGQQRVAGCVIGEDYPAPVIEERGALAQARQRMHDARRELDARREAAAIQQQHGSRRGGVARKRQKGSATTRRTPASSHPQGDLFKP